MQIEQYTAAYMQKSIKIHKSLAEYSLSNYVMYHLNRQEIA